MREGKTIHYSILAGWLITALAALLVATILVPEESRSAYFWHRVCWTQFLILLFWGSMGRYLIALGMTKDHETRFGGIAPTLYMVAGTYTMLSFVAMVIHTFVPAADAGNRIHIIVQVVFFACAALCVVFLSMARAGAAAGLDFAISEALSPRELHDLLALHESSLPHGNEGTNELKVATNQLRKTLLHSLNESVALAKSSQYHSLSIEVQELCLAIEGKRDNRYGPLIESARRLTGKAKYLSRSQARR